jgi:hypothetical protein
MAVAAMVAGVALTAYSQSQEGEAAKVAAKSVARQQVSNAKAAEAEGQRRAIEVKRQGARTVSDASAIMAATGGVTDDVGAIKTIADIEQVADYNALASLYKSGSRADNLRFSAEMERRSGKAAQRAGNTRALGTALSGGSKAYSMGKT